MEKKMKNETRLSDAIGWQLCPKCKGKGTLTALSVTCDVCNGKKIISINSGLPPN